MKILQMSKNACAVELTYVEIVALQSGLREMLDYLSDDNLRSRTGFNVTEIEAVQKDIREILKEMKKLGARFEH